MKKYGQEESLEVLRGEEAVILNQHLAKTGKSVADFDDSERVALHNELDAVRPKEEPREESPNSSSDSKPESK